MIRDHRLWLPHRWYGELSTSLRSQTVTSRIVVCEELLTILTITPRINNLESFLFKKFRRWLPGSLIGGVANSQWHRYGSRRLSVLMICIAETLTLRINDTGTIVEPFEPFIYCFLHVTRVALDFKQSISKSTKYKLFQAPCPLTLSFLSTCCKPFLFVASHLWAPENAKSAFSELIPTVSMQQTFNPTRNTPGTGQTAVLFRLSC